MRRVLITTMAVCLLATGLFFNSSTARAASENLITNPSVETADSTGLAPVGWQHASWGSNTAAFNWNTAGQDRSRSVQVVLTGYASGDAKWFFNPVSVSVGTEYVFIDYYKSNVTSSMVVAVDDAAGNTSYIWLADLPASNAWKKAYGRFTPPTGSVKATVYHLIAANGWLSLDNTTLKPYVPEVATITDGVPNNSFEQVSELNGKPLGWQTGGWGGNTATFALVSGGHSGSRSVKTTVSGYTNGDAKWYFDPQPVVVGQIYRYSDWYQSNIDARATVAVTMSDSTTKYITLRSQAKSPTTWSNYSDTFEMPLGAVAATVYHQVSSNGWLKIDDVALLPTTIPWLNRPLVSLTFDDGWTSIHDNGLPIMKAHGVVSTQYLVSSFLDSEPDYMTTAQVRDFITAGHQIGSHTFTHPDLTTLSGSSLTTELNGSKNKLSRSFGAISDFASPYGAYNASVITAIRKYYRSHRSVDVGYNGRDFDVYNIKVQNIESTTTLADVTHWVATAKATGTWLVLVYHQVDSSGDQYSVTPANLDAQITAIQAAGLLIVTVDQALAEILPQR